MTKSERCGALSPEPRDLANFGCAKVERVVLNKLPAFFVGTAMSFVKAVNDLNRVKLPLQITLSGDTLTDTRTVVNQYENM